MQLQKFLKSPVVVEMDQKTPGLYLQSIAEAICSKNSDGILIRIIEELWPEKPDGVGITSEFFKNSTDVCSSDMIFWWIPNRVLFVHSISFLLFFNFFELSDECSQIMTLYSCIHTLWTFNDVPGKDPQGRFTGVWGVFPGKRCLEKTP